MKPRATKENKKTKRVTNELKKRKPFSKRKDANKKKKVEKKKAVPQKVTRKKIDAASERGAAMTIAENDKKTTTPVITPPATGVPHGAGAGAHSGMGGPNASSAVVKDLVEDSLQEGQPSTPLSEYAEELDEDDDDEEIIPYVGEEEDEEEEDTHPPGDPL